jgi:hypothetical protein
MAGPVGILSGIEIITARTAATQPIIPPPQNSHFVLLVNREIIAPGATNKPIDKIGPTA